MNVSLEMTDDVTGKVTVSMEKSDYIAKVEKSLKKLKQNAKMPGFRPGMVPMSLVAKMYGNEVKAEAINDVLSKAMNDFIKEKDLRLVADPMASEDDNDIDIVKDDDFAFHFDLGLAPEINVVMNDTVTLPYYNIEVDEKTIEEQVDNYRRQAGSTETADAYEDGDILRGTLTELAEDGTEKEGGIKLEKTSLMPKYFSSDDSKALFNGAKKDAVVRFNLNKAYEGKDTEIASILKIKKEEVSQHAGDFSFQVNEVSRFKPAELDAKLFDLFFGKDNVKTEEEFRARIKSDIEKTYVFDSDYKFMMDVRAHAVKEAGEVHFPEDILKRSLLNNMKKEQEEERKNVDSILKNYIEELKWSLLRSKFAKDLNVQINEEAMMNAARDLVKIQFSQYGINEIPGDTLNRYAAEMMKDEKQYNKVVSHALDTELGKILKTTVKLDAKNISIADFNKMFEPAA